MPESIPRNSLNLRSEEVQEILTNPPSWIVRWGITLIFIFTLSILCMSFIIRYPDFVAAKVLITTLKPTEKLIAKVPGQLEQIFIDNGDTVSTGQRIAVIKSVANYKDVYTLKELIDSLNIRVSELSFNLELTKDLVLGEIEPAYIEFEKKYIDYTLLKDLGAYSTTLDGQRESLQEIRQRLSSQIRQKEILEQEVSLKKTELQRHRQLFEKGVISQQEYENKALEFLQIQKNINAMAITVSQLREAISSANQQMKTTSINEEEDNTKFLKNLAQAHKALQLAIRDWEQRYVLVSSIDGIASFQGYWGVHQFVNSGDLVFSILPIDNSKFVGKLTISSQNAGKVTLGQKVLIKVDNFPYQQYGTLIGRVEHLSISPDQEGNYVVYISLPEGTKTSYGQDLGFEQEMLGIAEIITEDLSIAERIFFKFKDLFQQ